MFEKEVFQGFAFVELYWDNIGIMGKENGNYYSTSFFIGFREGAFTLDPKP